MMKILFTAAVVLLLSFVDTFAQSPPVEDIQFWNETSVSFPIYKTEDSKGEKVERVGMFFNGVLRVGDNVSRPVDKRLGFGFDFRVNRFVSLTTAYLYVAASPVRGRREYETRLRFAVNLRKDFKRFSLRNRNLVEYRFRNGRDDSTRYRNRIQFSYPIRKKNGEELFTPYAQNEAFYDFLPNEWTRNEVGGGISKKINQNLTTEFFYTLRNNRGNTLKYVNIFGVNLRFEIE